MSCLLSYGRPHLPSSCISLGESEDLRISSLEGDAEGHQEEGVFYDDVGLPAGEIGIIPDFRNPDAFYGVDTPLGGLKTTLPFGSGGPVKTDVQLPSWNCPIAWPPGSNIKAGFSGNNSGGVSTGGELSTPVGRVSGSLNMGTLEPSGNIGPPQVNFPVAPGANAFVGLEW